MGSVELLSSPRLTLVNCQVTEEMVKAGWVYSYGLLDSVEKLAGEGEALSIQVPDFMQSDPSGGEMFHPNDTVDFLISHD